ncbi:MAG TPA: sigma 54-interacting transcriptional regulator [Kofleriaceae bacterium]|nr:sigma 54-interacting transcriptional regulator [Kofleriaceae bacterium]
MAYLVVRQPERVSFTVELRDGLQVGRDDDNDVVLADRQASRRHARFRLAGTEVWVADAGSTHGTLVNQQRIEAETRLSAGDMVQVGNSVLVFHVDDPSDTLISAVVRVAPPSAERRLAMLYEVSRLVGALGDPDQLASRILDTTLELLGAERAVLGLRDGRRFTRGAGDELVVSRTVLDALIDRRETVLLRGRETAGMPSVAGQGIRSAMGVPLVAGERVLGFLYVDDRRRIDRFSDGELDFLSALGHLAAAALQQAEERRHDARLAEAARADDPVPALIGDSEPMRALVRQVQRFAPTGAAVLVHGETGTGKELIARALHALSGRADEPFIAVNCAAIPDTMIESELFGHTRGAFTGAVKDKRGKLALAHRGTLFLDEIGDLSPGAQAKLLRVLEDGQVQPLGAETCIDVDVRLVSATHRDLDEERFRPDLYYRIAVVDIEVPALRDRGADVLLLADAFLARAAARLGRRLAFTEAARAALRGYGWPGNVRQLHNEVERAAILADGDRVDLDELAARGRGDAPAAAQGLAERFAQLEVTERELVREALARAGGNLSEAARMLGITRVMLKRRADRFGQEPT